jgi:hypothetical protein
MDLMNDRPTSTSEDVHYGKVLDPKQNKDPKKLGRVRTRVPELDGDDGSSGIPDDHLPWTQLERHENYGTQKEMSHYQMPQKDATVKSRFHGDDPYSGLGSGAPYSAPGALTEWDTENQYLRYGDKDPLANEKHHVDMEKKNIHSDHTQMDGPHNHRTRGVTTHYFTNSKSNTSGANQLDQGDGGGQQAHNFLMGANGKPLMKADKYGNTHPITRNHLGQEGLASEIGGFQAGDQGTGKAEVNYFSEEKLTLAIVQPKQQQQQLAQMMGNLHELLGAEAGGEKPHEADDKDLKKITLIVLEKDKITIQVNDGQGNEQEKSKIVLTQDDITVHSKAIKINGDDSITLTSSKIATVGNTYLGSSDAAKPVSAQGTIDSRGDSDTSNFLTKVFGT